MTEINYNLIEQKISPQTATANALVIACVEDIEKGRDAIRAIKALMKEMDDTFDPIIKKANEAHKEAIAQKSKHVEPLKRAKGAIEGKIADYTARVEREKREAAAKQAEADRKAREKAIEFETKRLVKLCEKAANLQEELEITEGELAKMGLSEAEEMVLSAHKNNLLVNINQTSGAINEKQAVIEDKATLPMTNPINRPPQVKVKGVVGRDEKIPEVVNPMALVKAVADGRCPLTVIDWNIPAIKKLVNAGMVLPGVLVTVNKKISIRG